jgi:hypothetical protein
LLAVVARSLPVLKKSSPAIRTMAATRLLQTSIFHPDQIQELVAAYESALVAKAIIECYSACNFDPLS